MSLNLGSTAVDDLKVGTSSVSAVYLGTTKVWPPLLVQLAGGSFVSGGGTVAKRPVVYYVQSDGWEAAKEDNVTGNTSQWLLSGAASDYEVRFTRTSTSGSGTSTASTGWLNCGTTRSVQATANAISEFLQADYTVELRLASSGVVLATTTVTLISNY